MKKISFVIPCYRSEHTIESVVDDIFTTMDSMTEKYDFEVILVNDCSPDNTYQTIRHLAQKYENVLGLSLSTNFGQQGALMAGFANVTGDAVVCLDDDGQTPPQEVTKLIEKYKEGYDVVYARYGNKKHSVFRNFGSRVNDKMASLFMGKPPQLYVSSYYIASRYVIDEVLKYKNPYPYILGLILRTTKNIADVEVSHKERMEGESGYTVRKLLSLWLNGFTAFSIIPLRVSTALGVITSVLAFAYLIYTIIHKIVSPNVLIGWSSVISSVLLVGGVLMCMLGMLGEYIGRMYISLNNSPQFVIKESTRDERKDS
jgi:undecaprenyl-phosphate 4-deoxy-4-formamido-L-arabinose transferase